MGFLKFSKRESIRVVAFILLNAFLLLDIAWAGAGEVSVITPELMLSAPV
ncbi:MAG: hypothetical protein KJ915_08940 [Candidatus Omnitrophica bacterium]|nr:hypothetical protein [Candidatus Omnitrophota bacterium]